MNTPEAYRLVEAIFGSHCGEGAMVENCPTACSALRIAFPSAVIGDEEYGHALRKDRQHIGEAIREWGAALTKVDEDGIPF